METQTPRHRHLVAFPVLVAALAVTFAQAPVDLPNVLSSVTQIFSTADDERFTFDSGVYGVVYAGGQLQEEEDHLYLSKGSVLLASEGVIRVTIDDVQITTLNGSIHLTRDGDNLVIAALTAPAVVVSGDQRMVVPAGMQWELSGNIATLNEGFDAWMKARLPRPLPISFIERKIGDLSLVRVPESILPEQKQFLPLDVLPEEEVLLPVSASHVISEKDEHVLGVVCHTVQQGDVDRFEELLNLSLVRDALKTDRGMAVVAVLLSQSTEGQTALRMLLLQQLITDESVWLASSFHPAFRNIAWAIFEPDVSVESHLTRVFLLPFSTFSPDPFSDFVLERFSVSPKGMLTMVGDSDAFIENVIVAHMPLIDRLEERGYPQRAMYLSQTLLDLIASADEPTQIMLQAQETLRHRGRIDLSPIPPKSEIEPQIIVEPDKEPEPEPEPEVTLSPQQVEAKAYQMLESAGALFTVNSAITHLEGNNARITDVLFNTPLEDRSVSFTLDVVTETVTDIEINGNTDFPYTPSFEGFVTWVRK